MYLDPRRSNGLIETLADCVAYQTLARLCQLWKSEFNDREDIKYYASGFLKYRDMKTAEKMKSLPPQVLADFVWVVRQKSDPTWSIILKS